MFPNLNRKAYLSPKIPGVGSVGLSFQLDLQFEATVNEPVELGFGFDVEVSAFSTPHRTHS